MTWEEKLVAAIIHRRALQPAIEFGLKPQHLVSPVLKNFVRFLFDWYNDDDHYGSVPSLDVLKDIYPIEIGSDPKEDIETLCTMVLAGRIRAYGREHAANLEARLDGDPSEIIEEIERAQREAFALLAGTSEEVDLALTARRTVMEEYTRIENGAGLTGIPWPWGLMNTETQGIAKGDFVFIYAPPKSFKTWLMLYIATKAFTDHQACITIYTTEMRREALIRRMALIIAQIDYRKYMGGHLSPEEKSHMGKMLDALEQMGKAAAHPGSSKTGRIVIKQVSGGVREIREIARKEKPDLIGVDGYYLLTDNRTKQRSADWRVISNISQDFKIAAKDLDIPVILTGNANPRRSRDTGGEDFSDIAFSSTPAMDCDIALNLRKVIDPANGDTVVSVHIPGGRETCLEGFTTYACPADGFQLKYNQPIVGKDAKEEKESRKPAPSLKHTSADAYKHAQDALYTKKAKKPDDVPSA